MQAPLTWVILTSDEHGPDVIQQNAFFYMWVISCVVSTCYTYTWDIKMDWGLFDKNAGENKFLREEVVYAYKVKLHSFCFLL